MALNADVSFTWIGHGTWRARTAKGKEILIDPWVMGNPAAPENLKTVDRCDLMLITHGHFDHIHDAVELAKKHNSKVLAIPETAGWLGKKGVENVVGFNKGGTFFVDAGSFGAGVQDIGQGKYHVTLIGNTPPVLSADASSPHALTELVGTTDQP